ncbi:MAG: ABC transporter permease [Actinomycetota bacterium]|nr:ABC transporter permease [Actinomycetota bacterium]
MSRATRILRSEYTKVTSTRMWWLLALVLFFYVGLSAAGIALLFGFQLQAVADGAPANPAQPLPPADVLPPIVYSLASSIGYVFPLLIGALSVTNEFRHQTLTPTFLASPRRGGVLGAKSLTAVLFGAFYGVIALLAAAGLGAILLALFDIDPLLGESDTWALIGRAVIAMALWAAVGVGVGAILPSQVGSVVVILAFTQFLEPILRFAAGFVEQLGEIAQYLPGAAGDALVGASFFAVATSEGAPMLEWWQGGLVLAGYAVLLTGIGYATSWRRDVT